MFLEQDTPAAGDIRVKGRHTTQGDGGLTFEYDGYSFPADDRFPWRARVYRDGELRGTLYGSLGKDHAAAIQNALMMAIALKIEGLRN